MFRRRESPLEGFPKKEISKYGRCCRLSWNVLESFLFRKILPLLEKKKKEKKNPFFPIFPTSNPRIEIFPFQEGAAGLSWNLPEHFLFGKFPPVLNLETPLPLGSISKFLKLSSPKKEIPPFPKRKCHISKKEIKGDL